MLRNQPLISSGDREQARDFINENDVVQAIYPAAGGSGIFGSFNIASATRITINHLTEIISEANGRNIEMKRGLERKGDVRHTLADISTARTAMGYIPEVSIKPGFGEIMSRAKQEMI